ncbi:MAG TPA: flagellar biosynthesis protein FlgI [Gammaproteobacteria bacterium]|nr:flagellar biosynthesis protein FlgI [Gammaproteobacteria bacterium]HBF64012.1 flagellar biosynthesis protein FlgI [Gammaproteobacteria bacterium]
MKTTRIHFLLCSVLMVFMISVPAVSQADRIKDLTTLAGARSNQLVGYGLVVGLAGTGDRDKISFTAQSLKATLERLGVEVDGPISNYDLFSQGVANLAYDKTKLDNVASVIVTATLPAFAKPGQQIDVNVATAGLATSLMGGSLILTELRGSDGEIYALAQGQLTVSGVDVNAAGSSIKIGVPTSGRIPGGAIVEREVETPFQTSDYLVFNTQQTDFTTVSAITDAINENFGAGTAMAMDGRSIAVAAPENMSARVSFLSMIENLDVVPGEPRAKVVVNSRTGTVVISRGVRVTAAAVTQGSLSVTISATNEVVQPNTQVAAGQAGVGGAAAGVANAEIEVAEEIRPMFLFQPGIDLREIVDAVNGVGASPSSLIAILEALKSAGSLRAELVVI